MAEASAGPDRNLEREVKLAVGDDFTVPDLTDTDDGLRAVAAPAEPHVDSYYDTPDLRLVRAGITLRRRDEGDRSMWTVKLPAPDEEIAGGMSRLEVNVPASGDRVPHDLARLVRARARSSTLRRVVRLRTTRSTTQLVRGDDRLAVIDDDRVTVDPATDAIRGFREVEVELVPEAPVDLLDTLVTRLRDAGADPADPTPKLARALGPAASTPPDLAPVTLGDKPSLRDVVRAVLTDHVRRLVDHDPVVRLDLHTEGVHQARVATRRLRGDLRTFRRVLDRQWSEPLRDELKWLGRALGHVRDPDVMVADLRSRVETVPAADRPPAERLIARLEEERDAALGRLQRVLDGRRYRLLLDRLVVAADAPRFDSDVDPERPAVSVLAKLAAKPWKRLRREIRELGSEPDDAALHQVRIRAKRARYAAEAAAEAVGSEADVLADRLADLQDVLGDLQDAVVAEAWLRRTAAASPADEATVAGLLIARRRDEAADHRASWEQVWDRADRKKVTRWLRT